MEPRIEPIQKQEQRLALTPQVRLSLHILQLSLPELKQFVDQQLEENPVLQEAPALSSEPALPSVGPDESFGRAGVAAMFVQVVDDLFSQGSFSRRKREVVQLSEEVLPQGQWLRR